MLRPSLLALSVRALSVLLALPVVATAQAQDVPPPADTPYPGAITVEVDATNLAQRIIRVKETIPVQPGALTLLDPKWLPGNHGPSGPIDKLAGIAFTADGKKLAWKRDPLDVYAFHVDIPAGVQTLSAKYEYLKTTEIAQGRVVMTPQMLNLQWNAVLLYTAGHYAARIDYNPRDTYPNYHFCKPMTSIKPSHSMYTT